LKLFKRMNIFPNFVTDIKNKNTFLVPININLMKNSVVNKYSKSNKFPFMPLKD
jgi:hypothetical protein